MTAAPTDPPVTVPSRTQTLEPPAPTVYEPTIGLEDEGLGIVIGILVAVVLFIFFLCFWRCSRRPERPRYGEPPMDARSAPHTAVEMDGFGDMDGVGPHDHSTAAFQGTPAAQRLVHSPRGDDLPPLPPPDV